MKNAFVIVMVILIGLVVGFFLFNSYIYNEKQGDNVVDEKVETPEQIPEQTPEPAGEEYRLDAEGLVFRYISGPEGYTLEEYPRASDPALLRMIRITPTKDWEDEQNRKGGEGSPSWNLTVYANTLKQSPSVWADENAEASNINLIMGSSEETVVGGANAVTYTVDGLYPAKVYVIAHGGFIFVVHASYLDETSPTFRDLNAWINSFTFVPVGESTQKPQGKIDVKVACESALAYMTFATGAEADVFVQDCVDGKHPEVIERYTEGLGLDGAAL